MGVMLGPKVDAVEITSSAINPLASSQVEIANLSEVPPEIETRSGNSTPVLHKAHGS